MSNRICDSCKYRVKLETFDVCRKKKLHNCKIPKKLVKCENYKGKYKKDESEE